MPLLTPQQLQDRYLDKTITKDSHWNRNANNPPRTYAEVLANPQFEKAPAGESIFHQQGTGNSGNVKYINKSTGEEHVFHNNGTSWSLVKDDVNKGTFNFGPEPFSPAHFSKDIVPWVLWGSGPGDTTNYHHRYMLALSVSSTRIEGTIFGWDWIHAVGDAIALGEFLSDNVLTRFITAAAEASPLVLDLDGDGIELTSLTSDRTVFWDGDQDGVLEESAWVGSDDGLLAIDSNGNGVVDGQAELFGTAFDDGFAILANHDDNADGIIDVRDEAFSRLRVWRDADGDGVTDAGELRSLAELDIVSISVQAQASDQIIAGNRISSVGTYTLGNGTIRTMADAWFQYDNISTLHLPGPDGFRVASLLLPEVRGYGRLPSLMVATSDDLLLFNAVRNLAMHTTAELFAPSLDLAGKFKALMFEWAKVGGIAPGSRGAYIDARELAFLETLMDSPFTQRGSPNPMVEAAATLHNAFIDTFNAMYFRFLAQTPASELFTNLGTYNFNADAFTGAPAINFTTLGQLVDGWNLSGAALVTAWSNLFRFIEGGIGLDRISAADKARLETLIDGTDASGTLSFAAIAGTIFPSEGLGLNGTAGPDPLVGGNGNDTLDGGLGNDVLSGRAGHDSLFGGGNDDTLSGESGDDTLQGGSGNDTYVHSAGLDTIRDTSGTDTLRFGAGVTLAGLKVAISPTNELDGHIYVNGILSVIVEDMFSSYGGIEAFRFADGSQFNAGGLIAPRNGTAGNDVLAGADAAIFPHDHLFGLSGDDRLTGGLGDDRLFGGAGNDIYVVTQGHDRIEDQSGALDKIQFGAGFTLAGARLTRSGNDLVIAFGSVPAVTIRGQFDGGAIEQLVFQGGATLDLLAFRHRLDGTAGRDSLFGIDSGGGGDILTGLGGDDRLYGYDGNDDLDGGLGNDFLDGGLGNDRYIVSAGVDVVRDGGGVDNIAFGAVDPARIGLIPSGYDLIVTVGGVPVLWIDDQFTQRGQIESLSFAGGQVVNLLARTYVINGDSSSEDLSGMRYGASPNDVIHGFDGNDRIWGYGGNDLLDGGAGDDQLFGEAGNDRYYVGSGANYVSDAGLASDLDDRIYLPAGVTPAGVTLARRSDGDLVVAWATGSVVIDRAYDQDHAVERLVFASGEIWDLLARAVQTVGSNADDSLSGNAEERGPAGDTLLGLLGDDRLSGLEGADVLDGGGGDDVLIGGNGGDSYRVGLGDDFIDEFGLAADGPDRIFLPSGLTPASVTQWRLPDGDLLLRWAGGSVRIDDGWDQRSAVEELRFASGEVWQLTSRNVVTLGSGESERIDGNQQELGSRNDHLQGLAGDDVLNGFDGADRLDGGAGDDELHGGAGGDTYVVGYGWDYVADAGATGDSGDILRIARTGITLAGLTFAKLSDGNVRISWNNGVDGVVIYRGLTGNNAVEQVELADGTRFLLAAQTFQNVTLPAGVTRSGDSAANSLVGGAGDDRLSGGDGNDTLEGGPGNDELYGGQGADTYRAGLGHDFLSDFGLTTDAADQVLLLASVARSALSFIRLGDGDLLVRWSTGSIRIDAAFGSGRAIETLVLSDGTRIDLRTVAFVTEGTTGAEYLQGNREAFGSRNDTIRAFDGDDQLYGYDGNDVLDGGPGNDSLYGERGGDRYVAAGHDWIDDNGAAGDAADSILFPAGIRLVDLTLTRTPRGELLVTWAGGSVGIDGAFTALGHIERFEFSGGAVATVATLPFTTVGTHGDDFINGNADAFGSRNDVIDGLDGDDRVQGGEGNDRLIGGRGDDSLYGGIGADSYVVGEGADYVYDAGAAGDAADVILLPASVLPQNVQIFRLGDGDLLLQWATGSVRIENAFETQSAVEQIRFANGTSWQVAQLLLETRGSGEHETLYGNRSALGSHNDTIRAFDGDDRLYGFDGSDLLDGGAGHDELHGGPGDDIYLATSGNDLFYEGFDGTGQDVIRFAAGIAIDQIGLVRGLGDDLELRWSGGSILLDGHLRGGGYAFEMVQVGTLPPVAIAALLDLAVPAASIVATGTEAMNVLLGKGGADTLRGLGGPDLLLGGDGTDRLEGGLGDDLLYGGNGNDMLDGGAGADTMTGGYGNDGYVVDNAGDKAVEASAAGGTDTVNSSVAFTLGANVENLTLTGTAAVNGTGNGLANILTGNAAGNVLNGGAGADIMRGGAGNDIYFVDNGSDQVVETSTAHGTDRVQSTVSFTLGANVENLTLAGTAAINGTGNGLANILTGNGAANLLRGGAGHDTLQGGAGADSFQFDTALGATNVDKILDFVRGSDKLLLENAVFAGLPAGALSAAAFALGTSATSASQRILYDPATGALLFDPDGSGAAAAIQFATLANPPASLSAADFLVV